MLEIKDLKYSLSDFSLNVNLRVKEKTCLTLIGPSGAGKTKFLELVTGLLRPDSGQIFMHGSDITDLAPEKRNMAFVYQKKVLFPHLNVRDNITYGLKCRKEKKKIIEQKLAQTAERFGLRHLLDRSNMSTLSGGEVQKVALARALILEPEVLILDEPMASLDAPAKREITQILMGLNREFAVTMIHVTHDLDTAAALSDSLALMRYGVIEYQAGVDEFFKSERLAAWKSSF